MTERLYYTDSFLQAFDACVIGLRQYAGATALVLDRSAFYPTSGGQTFDTGWLELADGSSAKLFVREVVEDEATGEVLHLVENGSADLAEGAAVHGTIDATRRLDHMQQHSGQHVLSAAFEKLYNFATVSFHMGDESCTIDLAISSITADQVRAAERLSNEIIAEDRQVSISFATADEAVARGVRKIPPAAREKLRLIDLGGFDLNACGGTHVRRTGQIGAILLRKTEKVRQGVRVEFVCGLRAINTARRDYETLTEAGAALSTHIWELPQQVHKSIDETKSAQKAQQRLLEEIAELQAGRMLSGATANSAGTKLIVEFFSERDLNFIKLLAQKLTRSENAIALLACGGAEPSLVFAQTKGLSGDMGALMKQAVTRLGTRGGGNRDMAQGGAPDASAAQSAMEEARNALG